MTAPIGANAGVIGLQPAVGHRAIVVLDQLIGDDDIADGQCRIEPARHAGEDQPRAAEAIRQQAGHDGGSDLAAAGFRQHHRMTVDPAMAEVIAADLHHIALVEGEPQPAHLLGQGRHDAERPLGFALVHSQSASGYARYGSAAPPPIIQRFAFRMAPGRFAL